MNPNLLGWSCASLICLLPAQGAAAFDQGSQSVYSSNLSRALKLAADTFKTALPACVDDDLLPPSPTERSSLGAAKFAELGRSWGSETEAWNAHPWPKDVITKALNSVAIRKITEKGQRNVKRCPSLLMLERPYGSARHFTLRLIDVVENGTTRYHAAFVFRQDRNGEIKIIAKTPISIIAI